MMHQSIATIDSPEFINLQPLEINPLMSSCEIKVLYLGENRNHSFITEEVAMEMAKTLRGAPIVGYYREDKEDFRDHGEKVIFDDEGVKFECMTKPYGFVAPDAQVWFQNFEDTDEFGNVTTRKYLMTTGYLWTGQYEECKLAVEEGRPQSMELDNDTLDGHWATDQKTGMDFFIINDAIFSKLCILGDDVEPCFEGASITSPQVSTSFTMDTDFKRTLYNMMQDLQKFALKGGKDMEKEDMTPTVEEEVVENNVEVTEEETVTTEVETEVTETENETEEPTVEETQEEVADTFKKEDDDEDENSDSEEDSDNDDNNDDEEDKKSKTKNTLEESENELSKLQSAYTELETKYQELVEFKKQIEDKQKDTLIESFYMLSDEDKKDVIENKSNYTLDEIEAKLSVICVRNKVNFDLDNNEKTEKTIEEDNSITTYNLGNETSSVPAWIAAIKNTRDSRKN